MLRTHRSAAAYWVVVHEDAAKRGLIALALKADPNATDLWYGLARLQLKANDTIGYNTSLTRLKELTPGVNYQVVKRE